MPAVAVFLQADHFHGDGIMRGLENCLFKVGNSFNVLVANEETFSPKREGGRELVLTTMNEKLPFGKFGGIWTPVFHEIQISRIEGDLNDCYLANLHETSEERKEILTYIRECTSAEELLTYLTERCLTRNTINILLAELGVGKGQHKEVLLQTLKMIKEYLESGYTHNDGPHFQLFNQVIKQNPIIAEKYRSEFMPRINSALNIG